MSPANPKVAARSAPRLLSIYRAAWRMVISKGPRRHSPAAVIAFVWGRV